MGKFSTIDRLSLALIGLLAGYQIVIGVEGMSIPVMVCYTVAFGVMLVGVLLLIILGLEALESPLVVIIFTVIPLSLSLGLVCEYLPDWKTAYRWFVLGGGFVVTLSRSSATGKTAAVVITVVHGIAGLIIFLLPISLVLNNAVPSGFILVGLGGALMGVGGFLVLALKAGRPILPQKSIQKLLPAMLLLMTVAFVTGFAMA